MVLASVVPPAYRISGLDHVQQVSEAGICRKHRYLEQVSEAGICRKHRYLEQVSEAGICGTCTVLRRYLAYIRRYSQTVSVVHPAGIRRDLWSQTVSVTSTGTLRRYL
jgi:hypothetical protein